MPANQEQLQAAEVGLHMLMDDDIDGARKTLSAQAQTNDSASPFALAGLGICDFLAAAVGMEDERLTASMEALAVAEKSARKQKAHTSSVSEDDDANAGQWWNQNGMEYEVLMADLAAAQAVSSAQRIKQFLFSINAECSILSFMTEPSYFTYLAKAT